MPGFKLNGNRVVVRAVEEKDIPLLYELIYGEESDSEWKKYDGPYFPRYEYTYEEYREALKKEMASTKVAHKAIIEVEGTIIGMVSFYWEYEPTRWLEMGITIFSQQHWSGGFGTEALALWTDYLFQHLEIERVGITTWSGNPRMMKCAEKVGMQLEGRMRKCRYYNGEYYDSIRMGILREEWEEKKHQLL
ncbi:MAG: GNAT family N-acetyltransferase [Bacillaceae bacterium]